MKNIDNNKHTNPVTTTMYIHQLKNGTPSSSDDESDSDSDNESDNEPEKPSKKSDNGPSNEIDTKSENE